MGLHAADELARGLELEHRLEGSLHSRRDPLLDYAFTLSLKLRLELLRLEAEFLAVKRQRQV